MTDEPEHPNADAPTDTDEAIDEATIVPFVPMQISPATREQRRQKRKGPGKAVNHQGRTTDNGRLPRPAPTPMHTLTKPAPRGCDLHKCTAPGGATIDLKVTNYTGNPDDQLTLVICKDHAEQFRTGAIVGFDWSPVYRHELPPHQQLQYQRPPHQEGEAPPNG